MLDQVFGQAGGACIKRLPGVAGPGGGLVLGGQLGQSLQLGAMTRMFVAHHANRLHHHGVAALLEQWEQDLFFLGHVLQ